MSDNMEQLPQHIKQPVLIMDVDETLFDTAPRKQAILDDVLGITAPLEEIRADYNLTNYLHTQEQTRTFFREFHSGKYLAYDIPIEHAQEVLQRLAERVTIVYLTGRHADGAQAWMAQKPGTLAELQKFHFPLPDDRQTFLLMKPYFSGFETIERQAEEDRQYKTEVLARLADRHTLLAGIGDSFSDMQVYSRYQIPPICLKRQHFDGFQHRLNELPMPPFVASDWLEVERRLMDVFSALPKTRSSEHYKRVVTYDTTL